MWRQFFDKHTPYVLLGLLGAHLLAALVQHSWLSVFPVVAAGIIAFVLTWKRVEWGLAFAFLEIFTGGHGHLFDLSAIGLPISLRISIFLGVMTASVLLLARRHIAFKWNSNRDMPWLVFCVAIIVGAAIGFLQNNRLEAFDDFNSYLPVLYILPIISIRWDQTKKRLLLMTLALSAVWVALTTLGLMFTFTHFPGKFLAHVYTFVRDARLFEITLLTAPAKLAPFFPNGAWYFRVFGQSQIVILAFLILFTAGLLEVATLHKKGAVAVLAVCFAACLAGMSRSFILAGIPVVVLLGSYILWIHIKPRELLIKSFTLFLGFFAGLFILWFMIACPLPPRPDFSQSAFYKADAGQDRDLAVSSRWNLLPPMMVEIWKSPIIGSGFGKEVTFISDDPRVRELTGGTGEWTTYRFEWGYQDLWLKTGILGLLAVMLIVASYVLAAQTRAEKTTEGRWMVIGLLGTTLFVLTVHIFTPYLNHPLGLALLLFPIPFLSFEKPAPEAEKTKTEPVPGMLGVRLGTMVISPRSDE